MEIELPIILPEKSKSVYQLIDILIVSIIQIKIIDGITKCDLSDSVIPGLKPYFIIHYERTPPFTYGIFITDGIRCAYADDSNGFQYYITLQGIWSPPSRKFVQDAIRTLVE